MVLGDIIITDDLLSNEKIAYLRDKEIINIKISQEINSEISTLIIGWKQTKMLFPDANILDKVISPNLYWTFSYKEDIQDFNEDIDRFVDLLYDDFVKNITYHSIDPAIENYYNESDIIKQYKQIYCFDTTYITDSYIYIYDNNKLLVLGIDLNYLKFFNFNVDNLVSELKLSSCDIAIEDYSETGIYQKYKKFLNKDFDKKYIPYLLFKETIQI